MNVTDHMIYQFAGEPEVTATEAHAIRSGLERFTFPGYPDNPVYLHPVCGTVVDVSPLSGDAVDAVDAGECDCENTGPWLRIYVECKP
jgi:hypothetical protein